VFGVLGGCWDETMMLRVAWRSLMTRPIRAAVLAAGFGFGIAVMVELLGVGQVILEQAHAPALSGGGDLVVSGPFGPVSSARHVIATLGRASDLADRVTAISATRRGKLFLITPRRAIQISATGGVPSLEKSIGDPEVSAVAAWTDAPGDVRWSRPAAGDVLRAMDRFHPIPQATQSSSSWAEWLYFNGRTPDGRIRVYLTFLVGPPAATAGRRQAGVRLQLEHEGRATTYRASGEVDEASVLASAPDLEIAGNRVRLEGATYRISLALSGRADSAESPQLRAKADDRPAQDLTGEISLDASSQRSLPPASIRGTGGWVSGYVVPVLSGAMRGTLRVRGESIVLENALGYHDHNWGFWEGVRWQWGQVAHDDVSVVYGRVFPPAEVADSARIPGFLAVLGPDGPLGFSSNVTIDDTNEGRIDVRATRGVDLQLKLTVDETVRTTMAMTERAGRQSMTFFQLGGVYRVNGKVDGREIDFSARGSAETFKPK
jgi:hypothetical protein